MPRQLPETDSDMFLSFRISKALMQRVDKECDRRMISRAYLFRKAAEEWLEEHEGRDT